MAFDILVDHGGTGLKDYISALIKPLQTNTNSLKVFETEYKKRAKFNGQKIVLQSALNNIFGVAIAPFIIVTPNREIGENSYFYNDAEISPMYFYNDAEVNPKFSYNATEVVSDFDFLIEIPIGIYTTDLERRVRAEANLYKLAGVTFDIITY